MSADGKLHEAAKVYSSHLQSTGRKDEGDSEHLVNLIKETLGGTSEASLSLITTADLVHLPGIQVPILVARRIVEKLGGTSKENEQRQVVVVDDNPETMAMRLKPNELVSEYDANEPDNAFGKRLKEISGGQPFLIFNSNGHLDVDTSIKCLQELRDNYPPRSVVMVHGEPRQPYKVGERPLRFADEHPLIEGQMLRPDGYSDTNVEWGRIDFKIRQLLALAAHTTKEIGDPNNQERIVFDAVEGSTFKEVAARYPRAYNQFEQLDRSQGLPNLKVPLKAKAAATAA